MYISASKKKDYIYIYNKNTIKKISTFDNEKVKK